MTDTEGRNTPLSPAHAIPDNSAEPLGVPAPSTAAILRRLLRPKGAEVPTAAFQSSI